MKGLSLLSRALVVATMTAFAAAPAQAQFQFYGLGGDVWVRYDGCDAGYTSDLSFYYNSGATSGYLFTCHVTAPGTAYNIGPVAFGDEVVFSLYVRNTGDTFYNGPASRNPDNMVHAASWAISDGVYTRQFGFEDVYGGGDQDYNDNIFSVGGVRDSSVAPEPASIALMGSGLVGLGLAGWRRRRSA